MSGVKDNTAVGWKQMPGQPRVCAGCGAKVVLGKGRIWFKTMPPLETWHVDCRTKGAQCPTTTGSESGTEPHETWAGPGLLTLP